VGLESTIVDVSDPTAPPRVLRPGPITPEALSRILGQPVQSPTPAPVGQAPGLAAPGLLARHYSPRTPLALLEPGAPPDSPPGGRRVAWIRFSPATGTEHPPAGAEVFWLGQNGDLAEAARELYALLRRLDQAGYAKIWCEKAPEAGWGLALNDRLRRAAGQG
jgi:L-threonylcarbamoyladenylate synthase